MTSFEIDTAELVALAAKLEAASAQFQKETRTAVRKTTFDIAADAKAMAPVDTGNLRESIQPLLRGINNAAPEGAVQAQSNYSIYVELGTSTQAPQPYLIPALTRRAPLLDQALIQGLERLASTL
jgi:HK97 gp10 family phage protein